MYYSGSLRVKAIVHPNIYSPSSFQHSSVKHERIYFEKCISLHTVEVNGQQNCLVTCILENSFFSILQKKGNHKWGE